MSNSDHQHHQGAITCKSCNCVFPIEQAPEFCSSCGDKLETPFKKEDLKKVDGGLVGALANMANGAIDGMEIVFEGGAKSMAERVKGPITCCWCNEHYSQRGERINCERCGGSLPMPACDEPGPRPEPAPRVLPPGFLKKLFVQQMINQKVALILIFVPLIFFFVPFVLLLSLVGLFIWVVNFYTMLQRHKVLKKGKAVLGKIERVEGIGAPSEKQLQKTAEGIAHDGLLFRMKFLFEIDGETVRGVHLTHNPAAKQYFAGQPIWVVYLEKKNTLQSLWPPL